MKIQKHFSLALVTGASSGIGEALASLLATKGIKLLLLGRNSESLRRIQNNLQSYVEVEILSADLSHPLDRQNVKALIQQKQPDLVINNAGFGRYGPSIFKETEELLDILEVNARAVLELTIEAAKTMVSAGKNGVILNVSSSAGELPLAPDFAVYSASKAFVNQFSQSLNTELRPFGICVLCAAPGFVNTHFNQRAGGQSTLFMSALTMTPAFAAEQIWRQIQKEIPFSIFDWKTRALIKLSKWLPKSWVATISHQFNQKRVFKKSS